MDEHEDKGGAVGSSTSESKEAVGESVSGETLVEGSCNGQDIMVEISGSDVFVDGVCADGGGGGGGGGGANSQDDVAHDGLVEVGSGMEKKSLDSVGHVVVDNLGSQEIGESSGDVVSAAGQNELSVRVTQEISVVVREKEGLVEDGVDREKKVLGDSRVEEGAEKRGNEKECVDVFEDMSLLKDGVLGHDLLDPNVENGVGSCYGDKEVVMTDSEQDIQGGFSEDGAEGGRKLVDGGDAIEGEVAVGGEVAVTDKENIECAVVGDMDTEAFDEKSNCSVDGKQANAEAVGGSNENHGNAIVDPVSPCHSIQVIAGTDAAIDENILSNSQKGEQLKTEECLHNDLAQVNNRRKQCEVNEAVSDAKNVGVPGPQGLEVEEQHRNVGTVDDKINSHGDIYLDSVSLCLSNDVDVTARDSKVNLDEPLPCPEDNENLIAETRSEGHKIDKHDSDLGEMESEEVLGSNIEDHGSAEKVQQLKSGQCIENVSSDLAKVDSSPGQEMEVDEHGHFLPDPSVEVPMSAHLNGMLPSTDSDQNLKAQKVCMTAELDTRVNNREDNDLMETEVLNSDLEFQGLAGNHQQLKLGDCLVKIEPPFHPEDYPGLEIVDDEHTISADMFDFQYEHELDIEEHITDAEEHIFIEEKSAQQTALESSVRMHQARYQLAPEVEGVFSVSDLVWGKVRSHPWWPGQIFDPSDSSETAMNYHKKDCFLVAYFGDHTFAWNEASLLKPFQTHFSQIEKQSNSEVFQGAVDCAVEEVSRRVELGLACSCIPRDAYEKIKFQFIENTGIQQESSRRDGVDQSASASSFEPEKLVQYIKELAQFPSGGADRLELVIAKAQLLAFSRLKGFALLPEFQFCGWLLENNADDEVQMGEYSTEQIPSSGQEISVTQGGSSHKRKHNLKDIIYSRKNRSMSELMFDTMEYSDDENESDEVDDNNLVSSFPGNKFRGDYSLADNSALQVGTKSISVAKVSTSTQSYPKPSFKIGDCIRRVASQLTKSPSILKCNSDKSQKLDAFDIIFQDSEETVRERMSVPSEYSSLDDLLSQLHLAAEDPMQGHSFLNIIISFFSDFRNSIISGQYSPVEKVGGRRKRSSRSIGGAPETFEFEDMNDSYWTDMVVQNGAEEQLSNRNTPRGLQFVPVEHEKPVQASRRTYSRKRYREGNFELPAEKNTSILDKAKRDSSPAELILNFPELDSVPSEMKLNKMFKCFGPLKESETEIDRLTSRARVVFKRGSDAEVAFSSAGKFNIFGSTRVNYEISYAPSVLFSTPLISTPELQEDTI